jgi:hypothetical protein
MELAPIAGVRAVAIVNARRIEPAPVPQFEIEASARAGDESYHQSGQAPDRGLEGEEPEADEEEFESRNAALSPRPGSSISLVA